MSSERIVAKYKNKGQPDVVWSIDKKGLHTVKIGEREEVFPPYADMLAANKFAACVHFSATKAGLFNPRYQYEQV